MKLFRNFYRFLIYLCRRRMAVMNTRPTGPVATMQPGQQTSNVAMTTGVTMKPGVSTSNLPSPHQPGIGLKPGTQTPPAHVLQVVKQVQEEAARQQAPHVGYGKVAPGAGVGVGVGVGGQTGSVMPPPQMQRPLPVQMSNTGGAHLIPMEQWTARYIY
jgi:E1A/CREB-binding protein